MDYILIGKSIYDNFIFECRYLLSKLAVWELRHVSKEQNLPADCMTKEGAKNGRFDDVKVFVMPLEFVQNLIPSDSTGTNYPMKIITTDSYAGRDMPYRQFKSILYNYKNLKLPTLDCQQSSLAGQTNLHIYVYEVSVWSKYLNILDKLFMMSFGGGLSCV